MSPLHILGVEEILPSNIVLNDFFGEEEIRKKNRMFAGTTERRHLQRDELASDFYAAASTKLLARLQVEVASVDMVLTNTSLADEAFTGCGAVVNKKIGAQAKWIFDLHNTGCVSFLYLLDMAQTYFTAGKAQTALLCMGQTAAGRIFGQPDTRQIAQAAVPGDGFAVAFVSNRGPSQVLGIELANFPEYSEDMYGSFDDGKKWWEARRVTGKIDFNESKSAMIMARGNKVVPQMVYSLLKKLKLKPSDIDYLITNQPNLTFLRNWREALLLPQEKHLDTFAKYANLFGAGIPITLSESLKENKIKAGNLVCLAGFSHACDFAGAAILKVGAI